MRYSGDWSRLGLSAKVIRADWGCLQFSVFMVYSGDCWRRLGLSTVYGVHWWPLKETEVVYSSVEFMLYTGDCWRRLGLSTVQCVHGVRWWLLKETRIVYSSVCSWCTVVTVQGDWGCLQFSVFMVYSGDCLKETRVVYTSMYSWSTVVTRADCNCLQRWLEETGVVYSLVCSWCTVVTVWRRLGLFTVQCIHEVQWCLEQIGSVCKGD